ncbi:hypothetical protein WJX74_002183 [Apatococcus lobatus]|uniref:OCRE domain-containing protein n=1 Tax=Apatococcus lobatus TaxID=904363 RepID=A0AAW1RBX3_9CHLO
MDQADIPNKRRKTVRFAEEASICTGLPEDDSTVRTNKGSKDTRTSTLQHPRGLSSILSNTDDAGVLEDPSCDPNIQRLLKFRRDLSTLKEGEIIEGDLLDDIAAAEEDYEDLEYGQEEGGVPLEPFHLRQERQEGYFDADGAYIQYKLDQVKDPWFESLAEMAGQRQQSNSDPNQASASVAGAPGSTIPTTSAGIPIPSISHEQQEAEVLDDEDIAIYKRRISEVLLPGETVLEALRRLGTPAVAASAPLPSGEAAAVAPNQPALSRGRKVPLEHRDVFDRLTEYSSLLLDHGDYLIHSQRKEDILHSIPIAAGPPAALPSVPVAALHTKAMDEDTDIFADASEPASTSTGAPDPPSSEAAQPVHMDPGFDQLSLTSSPVATDIPANSQSGHSHIDSQHANSDKGRGGDPAGGAGFWADLQADDVSAAASSIAGVEAGAAPLASSSMAAAKHPFDHVSEPTESAAEGLAAGSRPPGEVQHASASPEPMQTDPPAADGDTGAVHAETEDSAGQAHPAGSDPAVDPRTTNAAAADADLAAASGQTSTSHEMEGFAFDESSGLFYNSSLGYYFDPGSQLYGDAASGHWWKYHNGQYQLVS